MIIGFTASRELTKAQKIFVMDTVKNLTADGFVTGGCVGGDTIIANAIKKYHSRVNHKIIIPSNRIQVDNFVHLTACPKHNLIYMPDDTDYRDRNERIVEESDRMIAFWTGYRRSGTFMTINISKRANKIIEDDIHLI